MPERPVVFMGATGKAGETHPFEMKPRVVYPMEEGTALITYEEEVGEFVSELPPGGFHSSARVGGGICVFFYASCYLSSMLSRS